MVGSAAMPLTHHFSFGFNPKWRMGPTHCHVITTAASLSLGHFLRLTFKASIGISFPKSLKPLNKDLWEIPSKFQGINVLDSFKDSLSAASACYKGSVGGDGNRVSSFGKMELDTSSKVPFGGRGFTNTLLIINALVFIANVAANGKLISIGGKINSYIDKGQLWRLATSSLLHVNIFHLMVNCFSLNSIGPSVERANGPRKYLAIYFTSAIAGAAMSYRFCKSRTVGASGAISGLAGSCVVFLSRNGDLVKDGKDDLRSTVLQIALNIAIGLICKDDIDNWGHLGGLLGGAATSWLIGPSWKYQFLTDDGRKVFIDRAPIFSLVNAKNTHWLIM